MGHPIRDIVRQKEPEHSCACGCGCTTVRPIPTSVAPYATMVACEPCFLGLFPTGGLKHVA